MNSYNSKPANSRGYTLIELMITVGIIGVLAAIAIPAYEGYIASGKTGTVKTNLKQLAMFEETYFYENGTYLAGVYNPSAGTDTLTTNLGWRPDGDEDKFSYKVEKCASDTILVCFKATATYVSDPTVFEEYERQP